MTVYHEQPEIEVEVSAEPMRGIQSDAFDTAFVGYLKGCWDKARTAKANVTERLLQCERQRRGKYDPERAHEIATIGGSDIFMMLTDIKCRAASSWIRDVMLTNERPFDLVAAQQPMIPPEMKAMIIDYVEMEATEFIQNGGEIHPEVFRARMEEIHETIQLRLREEANDSARRMEGLIEDQLNQGGWSQAFYDAIDDFVTYPTAIIKGPVVRRKKRLTWGEGYTPIVLNDFIRGTSRVSPYDIYPSPNSSGPNDGYIIERHKLRRTSLESMIGTPGYSDDAIMAALDHYGESGLRYIEVGDNAHNDLQGKSSVGLQGDNIIEALEFWGPVSGSMLMEWGLPKKGLERNKSYECNVWIVGSYVIKAIINPDPLGERPYDIASWGHIPGAFWGTALPEIVRDVQVMCNAAARALANNMGIASGPQAEVHVDRLADGEDVTNLHPWKIWQTTTDRTGGGQAAIRYFQPDMKAAELMGIYQTFAKQADEVTGIPNYIYGSNQVGGAGRTASGLSMLMDNAAKGIKQAVTSMDRLVQGVVRRLYVHNMMYSADPYVKGDFTITAKGAMGLIAKEQLQVRRNEFLQATANPVDLQIVGAEGRSYLLRELARGLQMDTDKLVPPPEMRKYLEQKAMEAASQMPQQGQMPAPQTTDVAGNPAGGQQAALV